MGDVNDLKTRMNSIGAYGGGDTPEDWVGGYNLVLNVNMGWRRHLAKIIIHIADAGAHHQRFSDGDIYNNSEN